MTKFYYAVCHDGADSACAVGEVRLEPLRELVKGGGEALHGLEPEWCCPVMKGATGMGKAFEFQPENGRRPRLVIRPSYGPPTEIGFCPFCGEPLTFEAHLVFDMKPTNPRWIHDYQLVIVESGVKA